ncbi:ATP-binding protein [Clostridium sp.]|uniref:ATP-binding protein n=1 Tax=Clostridium sp. TaxID=1506 RepID=UPI00352012DE
MINPKLYDTLSSFSNKPGGGIIILGIDENRDYDVVGIYDPEDIQKKVKNQCNDMEPAVRANFNLLKWEENKYVLLVEIPEVMQEEKPCFYKGAGIEKGSYIRVGDSDERMNTYEIYNLTSYNKKKEEDLRVIDRSELDDLDMELVTNYLNKIRKLKPNFSKIKDDNVALSKLGIIARVDSTYKPTIAGLLCFGICPELLLPQLVVKAMVIPGFKIGEVGDLGERFTDNKNITGTISEMIKKTMDFITKNMKKRVIISPDTGERDDKFEYPVEAIREAIINSLVHRDYSKHTESSYISIKMYNDRLEISNPGGLYGNLTIEELTEVINPPVRNKTLVRILEEVDIIENRSSGIATMIMAMRELRLEPPIFENKRGNFNVIFKNHTLMTKEDRKWLNKINKNLSENEALALIYLRSNDRMTNGDYQKINSVNRDKALQELKGLIKKDLIESHGIGSGSYYKLKEHIRDVSEYINNNNQNNIKYITTIGEKAAQGNHEIAQDNQKTAQDNHETAQDKNNNLNKTERAVVDLLEKNILSKVQIANELGYKTVSGNLKEAIKNLLELGLIELTIPDKPKSKNQKYRLK